uniref:Major tropism determinant second domain-containing protein n=1 Tax=Desulfovibrio sp. U5L TaxID=596152 RepID=I2Q014_9BACT
MAETPIPATYLTATTFSVAADNAGDFPAGVRVQANCGADGTRYGTSTGYAGTTIGLSMDAGGLTSNLVDVLHGNDVPASLANHGHTGQADGGLLTAVLASLPAHYARSALAGLAGADAAGRRTLALPGRITVNVNDAGYALAGVPSMDLNVAANWDAASPDYTNPANRAGKDISVYACVQADGTPKLLFSANATFPAGYDATTSRKIMGFHCLCLSVGTVDGHALSGFATGDILPASLWDLGHRSAGDQAGRVYSPVAGGKWGMIYLPSVSGGKLLSAYGGTIACGDSTPAFHWFKFTQWLGAQGERPMTQMEFVAFSLGSNQGSALGGTVKPATTGGHVDTNGRRMVSDIGCEDCCGVLFQWGAEAGGGAAAAGYVNAFDANDYGVLGQHTQAPNRVAMGGNWSTGTLAGSRCSNWTGGPLTVGANTTTRGVSEPLAGGI